MHISCYPTIRIFPCLRWAIFPEKKKKKKVKKKVKRKKSKKKKKEKKRKKKKKKETKKKKRKKKKKEKKRKKKKKEKKPVPNRSISQRERERERGRGKERERDLPKSRISFNLVSYYILISMHMSYFTTSCISPHFVSHHLRMSPHLVYPHILNLPKSRILSYLVSHHISYCNTILCIIERVFDLFIE